MKPIDILISKLNNKFKGRFKSINKINDFVLEIERNSGEIFKLYIENSNSKKQIYFKICSFYDDKNILSSNCLLDNELKYFVKFHDGEFFFFDRTDIKKYFDKNENKIHIYLHEFPNKVTNQHFSIGFDFAVNRFLKYKL